jgi:flagellar M-ring protein FliF
MAIGEQGLGGTTNRQIALVAGAALGVAVLVFLLWYVVIRTPFAPAFTDLKSADASIIIEELKRQKIPHDLADNGATIRVPEDQVDGVRVNVLGGDLPLKGIVGFELFNQSDMGLTEFAQKINYQRALQGELARTLMSLENIDTARVHLSLPDSGIFERDKRAAKASVTIAPKFGKVIDAPTVSGIQRLVASAVPELEIANVAVLDAEGQLLSQDLMPASALGQALGSPIEQEFAARIRDAASLLIPDPAIRVSVKIAQDLINTEDASLEQEAAQAAAGESGRQFPIRISIIFPTTPDPQLRTDLVPVLTESVDYDPARGDSLMLLTSPNVLAPAPMAPRTAKRSIGSAADWAAPGSVFSQGWLWLLLGAGLIGILFWAVRRFSAAKELTVGQREAFADRLKTLIDEQGARGSGAV